jgi:hypothetical protein
MMGVITYIFMLVAEAAAIFACLAIPIALVSGSDRLGWAAGISVFVMLVALFCYTIRERHR